jgi:hypothetical protein
MPGAAGSITRPICRIDYRVLLSTAQHQLTHIEDATMDDFYICSNDDGRLYFHHDLVTMISSSFSSSCSCSTRRQLLLLNVFYTINIIAIVIIIIIIIIDILLCRLCSPPTRLTVQPAISAKKTTYWQLLAA